MWQSLATADKPKERFLRICRAKASALGVPGFLRSSAPFWISVIVHLLILVLLSFWRTEHEIRCDLVVVLTQSEPELVRLDLKRKELPPPDEEPLLQRVDVPLVQTAPSKVALADQPPAMSRSLKEIYRLDESLEMLPSSAQSHSLIIDGEQAGSGKKAGYNDGGNEGEGVGSGGSTGRFLGVGMQGKRIAFLLDASESMRLLLGTEIPVIRELSAQMNLGRLEAQEFRKAVMRAEEERWKSGEPTRFDSVVEAVGLALHQLCAIENAQFCIILLHRRVEVLEGGMQPANVGNVSKAISQLERTELEGFHWPPPGFEKAFAMAPDEVYYVTDGGGIAGHYDGSTMWELVQRPPDTQVRTFVLVHPLNEDVLLRVDRAFDGNFFHVNEAALASLVVARQKKVLGEYTKPMSFRVAR